MVIAYYSRIGNVRDFVQWYLIPMLGDGYEAKNIEEWDVDEPYILVTPTYDFGKVPEKVMTWLHEDTNEYYGDMPGVPKPNNVFMEGVIGSGNRNSGQYYGQAAVTISEKYGVPLIAKFELKGNEKVAEEIRQRIEERFDV